jgi:hypothetical protein
MVGLFRVCQTNLVQYILKSLDFIAGSSYRLNLVSNGANEKGCEGAT